VKDQAQNSNYQRAPNAEVHTPKTARSPGATAAIVTTIFNILVGTARVHCIVSNEQLMLQCGAMFKSAHIASFKADSRAAIS